MDVIRHYPVTTDTKLLEHLIASMPEMKRTRLKSMLKHGQVAVNGVPVSQFDIMLTPADRVEVNHTREFQMLHHPRVKPVYEDDDLIVVSKGYGLLSMGNDRHRGETAYSVVRDYVKRLHPANKIFIVHRLDQHTSGLMMFARNIETKERLQHNWNNMVLDRKYVAVVEGYVEQDEGTVESYLVENSRFEVYSTTRKGEGQKAVTHYKVLGRNNGYTLMELTLATGRKNQIRVHMRDLGHPIAGDRKYGAKTSPMHRVALHARTLRFVHPTTRRDMNFTSDIPAAFLRVVRPGAKASMLR